MSETIANRCQFLPTIWTTNRGFRAQIFYQARQACVVSLSNFATQEKL